MKEDILEQIVDEYLNILNYFTLANVKFKPSSNAKGYDKGQDSIPSDIDIIGYTPTPLKGRPKVIAVSCKSWQDGFWPKWELNLIDKNKSYAGRERWRSYRELTSDKWAEAFKERIHELTGETDFEYWTVCLFVKPHNDRSLWTERSDFQARLTRNIRIVTLRDMITEISEKLTTTPAGSEVGRLVQVMKAAKVKIN